MHILMNSFKILISMSIVYYHSYLLPDKNRNSKQKTPVVRRSLNPIWNYTFAYDGISLDELSERALELTVWDHDRLASNEFLGGIRLSFGTGMYCRLIAFINNLNNNDFPNQLIFELAIRHFFAYLPFNGRHDIHIMQISTMQIRLKCIYVNCAHNVQT